MRIGSQTALTALIWLNMILAPSPAAGQPETDLEARATLLGRWLDVQASQQRTERRFTGGSLVAIGSAGFGFGTALLVRSPRNEISKGGGIALVAAGAFGAGLGIFRLVVESEAEDVARRWNEARATDLSAALVARFEGELYAAAQHARKIQLLTRWLGLATTIAGITVLVATPLTDLSAGGTAAGYVAGGLLVLGGGINVGSSLATPPPIKAWKSYLAGKPPDPGSRRLFGVAPRIDRHFVGLSFAMLSGRR
jgi:hypothetical protein